MMALAVAALCSLAATSTSAHVRFRFIGPVVKMDSKTKLLTMKPTNSKDYPPEIEIGITAKTTIQKDGKKVTAAALAPGVYVVVDASGDDALSTDALAIKIVPPPQPAPQRGRGRP
jgi:uncharacterized protein (DUF2141 family)